MVVLFNVEVDFQKVLNTASAVIWIGILTVVLLIFVMLTIKKQREKTKEKILKSFRLLIEKALFYEPDEEGLDFKLPVPEKIHKLLRKRVFQQWLIDELVRARKNLSGNAHENIKNLYEQLNLFQLSLKKLSSINWNVKVQGIQELCIMDQSRFMESMAAFVDHDNADIRAEAQIALVHFRGFQGLDFLDTITKPVSYWNRIRLLEKVAFAPYQEFTGLARWLQSPNDSVILFALRLTGIYHIFNVHDEVVGCLNHGNESIRIESLRTLEDVYSEKTSKAIISRYEEGDLKLKIAVLQTLSKIGDSGNLDFLRAAWKNDDPRIKLAAARAIISSADDGIETLKKTVEAEPMPYQIIFEQLKAEAIL